jgi:hypothetical protein
MASKVPFHVFIGGARTVGDWDTASARGQDMQQAAGYLLSVLPQLWPLATPLRKLDTSTVFELVETGVDVGLTIYILTTDVATPGVGIAYRRGVSPILGCEGKGFRSSLVPSRTT